MKYRESLIVLAIGGLLASCSGSDKPEPDQSQPKSSTSTRYHYDKAGRPGVQESKMSSTSATVEALDQESRNITLRKPSGTRTSFKVGDQVKNLHKVRVGDRVVVDYYESLAIQVVKPGTTRDQRETMVYSAEPGETPAGSVTEKTTMTATIEQIDRSVPSITLRDEDGKLYTVRVRHPERLKLVKVGDTLKITYTEAVAVSVEPAPHAAR
jgi:hypothetical protein